MTLHYISKPFFSWFFLERESYREREALKHFLRKPQRFRKESPAKCLIHKPRYKSASFRKMEILNSWTFKTNFRTSFLLISP